MKRCLCFWQLTFFALFLKGAGRTNLGTSLPDFIKGQYVRIDLRDINGQYDTSPVDAGWRRRRVQRLVANDWLFCYDFVAPRSVALTQMRKSFGLPTGLPVALMSTDEVHMYTQRPIEQRFEKTAWKKKFVTNLVCYDLAKILTNAKGRSKRSSRSCLTQLP